VAASRSVPRSWSYRALAAHILKASLIGLIVRDIGDLRRAVSQGNRAPRQFGDGHFFARAMLKSPPPLPARGQGPPWPE